MTQMYCDNPLLMELERAMTFDRADYVLSSDTKMLTLKTNTGYTFIWKR